MIEKRHPAFEQKALRGELQNLVVDGEIAAFERHVRAAEFGGFAQEFERDSADMLFAEMAEFADRRHQRARRHAARSEEQTSELQSLMRISYAVFCLNIKN